MSVINFKRFTYMEYNFSEIEVKWQKFWSENKTNKVVENPSKPKFYVLDMFPYPSGAGLHVGHPLGYIASDIYSRFKRMKGFNVLHPMGYDAFGLPAEQYAIQTGQHPAITTENNIKRYRQQLDKIGFCYDWDREVRTCEPSYYHWTQWAFIQMFHHYYNHQTSKAESINELIAEFEINGNQKILAAHHCDIKFTADQWKEMSMEQQQETLLCYRIAYLADTKVNWCSALGTVLANDEVKDGFSVRGGHPVEQKTMKQWCLRVTAYAERLLKGLDHLDWSDSLKEMQKNWIGKSEGAEIDFEVKGSKEKIKVFTTRPDTIFGASFMVLAPENELVSTLVTTELKNDVDQYIENTKKRTERERIAETKSISGVFIGSYAINPFTQQAIPVWISEYVLAGYGTGAIMAVPAHDSRDYAFAKYYSLPIIQVVSGGDITNESYDAKEGKMMNSGIINGLEVKEAIAKILIEIEKLGIGIRRVNYKLRDAIFSRQRYWGEPFPVFYKNNLPYTLNETDLPLILPEIDKFLPTETGEPPLARSKNWNTPEGYPLELSTMPGFAGSSAYYLRYMDPKNETELVSKTANEYWQDVDLYIGGTEHATGHLIYSRFWNKFLFDLGKICKDEPFKKLINQGMIQGRTSFVYRVNNRKYAEYLLWEEIKEGKLGCIFKRDYKLGSDIFTFCCEEKHFVIELRNNTGLENFYNETKENLHKKGFELVLISTEEVIENLPRIIESIKNAIEAEFEGFTKKQTLSKPLFVSYNLSKEPQFAASEIRVDISIVQNDILDLDEFRKWRIEFQNAEFILEDGKYICGSAVEKMSKTYYNVVTPDDIVDQYGADTLRMYEMFLGPLEQSKPWDINGIEGVHKFLRKFWRLFHPVNNEFFLSDEAASKDELKILHRTVKRIEDDIERFSFNTCISGLMICINDLIDLSCNKRMVLEPLICLISPFAPHISEELWQKAGYNSSVTYADFPVAMQEYLIDDTFMYPVAINGKKKWDLELPIEMSVQEIEKNVRENEKIMHYTEGKAIKKIIIVPSKIINIVV